MSEDRSQLLQIELPQELAALGRKEGLRPESAWMTVCTDLDLAGRYRSVYIIVEPERLATLAAPEDGRAAVRILLSRADIKEVRTRQGEGGGFLEARVGDVYVELLAYSNSRADVFHKVSSKLKAWIAGASPEVNREDDVDPHKCPKCGLPLEFKGDLCRRCINRGAVFLRVLKMMSPYMGKALVMLAIVMVAVVLNLVPQFLAKDLIDRVLAPEQAHHVRLAPDQAIHLLLLLVAAIFGTWLVVAVFQIISGRLASFVGTQITYDMRSRVFRHLTDLSVGYYDRYNVGQLMTRVVGDTEQMKGFVNQLTNGFMAQFITVLAVSGFLFYTSWKLALIALLPTPLVVLSAVFFWKRIYPRYYRIWDANSKLNSALNTILSGIRVVKAFGQENHEQERFGRSSSYVRNSFRDVEYTVSTFNPTITLFFQLGGVLVWFLGGRWVLNGALTLGELILFLSLLWMLYSPLGQLTQFTNWLTQFLTATQRTFEILDTTPQVVEAERAKALPDSGGHVRFENVAFGYSRHEPIIKGVSLEIRPGEHVGVVGKSGSGKTTLVNLLARFYDVDEGRVTIDGIDLRDLQMDALRGYVGVVLQEPFLFRGTIYANITYGRRDATPEQVLAAAKAANAHNFILKQPLGYDTYIGERGAGLSGGERQRISIARALLYNPKILILDEATSNVDTESELLIQEALERVTRGRTTVAIAHRLSTLKNCDRVFVVDDGKIIERGTHDELLKLGGVYFKLVKIQTELTREPSVDALNVRRDKK